MSCRRKEFLDLPFGNKLLIYRINSDCEPIFTEQFLPLWNMLSFLGEYGQNALLFDPNEKYLPIVHPNYSKSTLIGVPYLTDPNSVVKILSFTNDQLDGPITNDGFLLYTYNDGPDFIFSWKILTTITSGFKIGFYTSDEYMEQGTNELFLITSDKGPCIFSQSKGHFLTQNLSRLYVAVNQDCKVKIQVTIKDPIAKDRAQLSATTYDTIETKYLTVSDKCGIKYKADVCTFTPFDQLGIKTVSNLFTGAASTMQKYLNDTALTITDFGPLVQARTISLGEMISLDETITYTNLSGIIPIIGYNKNNAYIYMNTSDSTPPGANDGSWVTKVTDAESVTYTRTFRVQDPLPLGKVARITPMITNIYNGGIGACGKNGTIVTAISFQKPNGGSWPLCKMYDFASQKYVSADFTYWCRDTFNESIILDPKDKSFGLCVFIYSTKINEAYENISNVIFDSVLIEYVTNPTPSFPPFPNLAVCLNIKPVPPFNIPENLNMYVIDTNSIYKINASDIAEDVYILMVGGGGGGGDNGSSAIGNYILSGGGGGGRGIVEWTLIPFGFVKGRSVKFVVGAGGAGGIESAGENGTNSIMIDVASNKKFFEVRGGGGGGKGQSLKFITGRYGWGGNGGNGGGGGGGAIPYFYGDTMGRGGCKSQAEFGMDGDRAVETQCKGGDGGGGLALSGNFPQSLKAYLSTTPGDGGIGSQDYMGAGGAGGLGATDPNIKAGDSTLSGGGRGGYGYGSGGGGGGNETWKPIGGARGYNGIIFVFTLATLTKI